MENWKAIQEYEMYEVSNEGRVRRWKVTAQRWKDIKPNAYSNAPYRMVSLSKNGKFLKTYIHRLVAQAFVPNPNPDEYDAVCFINGDIKDVRADNLYWSNQAERMTRRQKEGGYIDGRGTGNAKLTKEDVKRIKDMWRNRIWEPCPSQQKIAKEYGVHSWTIYALLSGRTWKEVQ